MTPHLPNCYGLMCLFELVAGNAWRLAYAVPVDADRSPVDAAAAPPPGVSYRDPKWWKGWVRQRIWREELEEEDVPGRLVVAWDFRFGISLCDAGYPSTLPAWVEGDAFKAALLSDPRLLAWWGRIAADVMAAAVSLWAGGAGVGNTAAVSRINLKL